MSESFHQLSLELCIYSKNTTSSHGKIQMAHANHVEQTLV